MKPGPAGTVTVPATARPQPQPARSRSRGSKPIGTGGPGRPKEVDENLLVRRYAKASWTIAACARAAGITDQRARDILLAHDVRLRKKAPLDEAAVTAAYQRQQSLKLVAIAFSTHDAKITRALDGNCRSPQLSATRCRAKGLSTTGGRRDLDLRVVEPAQGWDRRRG